MTSNIEKDIPFEKKFGAYLLTAGFREWFLVLFRTVENSKFIEDKLHDISFELFQGIYDGKKEYSRVCFNEPPRSAKTTLIAYFMIYACLCGKCNFIYTSFSNLLLNDCKRRIKKIITSIAFNAFYGENYFFEEYAAEFADSFFKEQNDTQLVQFNINSIMLGESVINLTPLGSTTGLGAGCRGTLKYSGGVFMDDINKVTDTLLDKRINEKTQAYFSSNIMTRLNIPTANIFNCQQRITTNDMTAYLTSQYNFTLIKVPLLNPDGSCNLSSQYTDDRINELKQNNNTWTAQYQQEPIAKVDMAFIGQMFDIDKLRESEGKPAPFSVGKHMIILGVDPKREGTDGFAVVWRQYKQAKVVFYNKKQYSCDEACNLIIKLSKFYNADRIYIDSGKGEGIVDMLLLLGYGILIREVKFGSESHRPDCFNKRSAMYADLRDWVTAGGCLPPDSELIEELAVKRS
jgi:hypothetical protein